MRVGVENPDSAPKSEFPRPTRSDPQLPGEKRVATPLHEARHTCASVLIAAGVNAKAITHYLGHSSIDVTFDRYGHLMPGPARTICRWAIVEKSAREGQARRSALSLPASRPSRA